MNIVFDLGGVVVRWDPDAIVARVFGDAAARRIAREIIGSSEWLELDRGTLEPRDMVTRAAARTGLREQDIAALLEIVPPSLEEMTETVDLMRRLKARGHTLYCISNMQVASIAHLEEHCTFWPLLSGAVISCRLQLCKPDPAIYAHLLAMYQLRAEETVFIDDVEANVIAAQRFGMHGVRFENAAQCADALHALGCI